MSEPSAVSTASALFEMRLKCGKLVNMFSQVCEPNGFVKLIDGIEWTKWFAPLPTVMKLRC